MNKKILTIFAVLLIFLISGITEISEKINDNEVKFHNEVLKTGCSCDLDFNLKDDLINRNDYSPIKPRIISTPEYFNWMNYEGGDWTTSSRDQGNCGSCWDFAAIGALESIINIREGYSNLDPDLSEQYVLSCLSRAGSCRGGLARSAYKYINYTTSSGNDCNGVILESCMPYQANDDIPCSDKCPDWEEKLIPISDWGYWYPDGSSDDIEAIKSQIMQHGPVVATMLFTYYEHGENNLEEWGWTHHDPNDYYAYPGPYNGANHQVVIVGWNDDQSIENGGYWIVKNSCSSEWGYNGFFNIEYGSLNIDSVEIDWVDYDSESYNNWSPNADAGGFYFAESAEVISLSAGGTVDPEEDIIDYSWDLGDGTIKNGVEITHIYDEKGVYEILLNVSDNQGNLGFDQTWAFIDESNDPPNKPVLRGRKTGRRENEYKYTFYAKDPDGDDVFYYVNWGDTYWTGWWEGWIGPFASGEKVELVNSWDEDGAYVVRVKAKDKYEAKSEWTTLQVSIPKSDFNKKDLDFFQSNKVITLFLFLKSYIIEML
jgi:C1A family cysteine protease